MRFLLLSIPSIITISLIIVTNSFSQSPDSTIADQLYNKSKPLWYSNVDSSIYYLNQSLQISEDIKYTRGKAYALYGLGTVNKTMFKRFEQLTQSLALFEEIHDDYGVGLVLPKIGYTYDLIGDREKALGYYQRALEVKRKLNDVGGIALSLINIGLYESYKGDFTKALSLFQESLVYRHKAGNIQGIAYAQVNIGEALRSVNRIDEAKIWADSAVMSFAQKPDIEGSERALHLLAEIYNRKNETEKKIRVYKKMIEVGAPSPYNHYVLEARKGMVKYFEEHNDIKNAFAQQSIYTRIKDSLSVNDYRIQTQKIANEYEFKTLQEAEARKKQEADRKIARKNSLEYSGIAVIVFVVFALIFATRKRIGNSQIILLLSLLLLFEFVLVLTDPIIDPLTSGDPILKLVANIVLALLILPAHNFLEKFIQRRVFANK